LEDAIPQRLKAVDENRPVIAAVNRCATQNQERKAVSRSATQNLVRHPAWPELCSAGRARRPSPHKLL